MGGCRMPKLRMNAAASDHLHPRWSEVRKRPESGPARETSVGFSLPKRSTGPGLVRCTFSRSSHSRNSHSRNGHRGTWTSRCAPPDAIGSGTSRQVPSRLFLIRELFYIPVQVSLFLRFAPVLDFTVTIPPGIWERVRERHCLCYGLVSKLEPCTTSTLDQ
jgi:hypothetical protein